MPIEAERDPSKPFGHQFRRKIEDDRKVAKVDKPWVPTWEREAERKRIEDEAEAKRLAAVEKQQKDLEAIALAESKGGWHPLSVIRYGGVLTC